MLELLVIAFGLVTVIASVQIMFSSSIGNGVGAILATCLPFVGAATFIGSFLARKEKKYSTVDLLGIGAIAAVLIVTGFAVAYWSDFHIRLFGYSLSGVEWLLVGMALAVIVTRKRHAL
jgi:hypothetical protein